MALFYLLSVAAATLQVTKHTRRSVMLSLLDQSTSPLQGSPALRKKQSLSRCCCYIKLFPLILLILCILCFSPLARPRRCNSYQGGRRRCQLAHQTGSFTRQNTNLPRHGRWRQAFLFSHLLYKIALRAVAVYPLLSSSLFLPLITLISFLFFFLTPLFTPIFSAPVKHRLWKLSYYWKTLL